MPVIVLDRSVRSDDYPWEEAVWWVPSADAFVSFCCYIKGKAKKSMERIEGTVCCVRSGSSRPTAAVAWSIKLRDTQSPFSFDVPLFLPLSVARLLPSKNLKGADVSVYTQHLCTHTGHVQYTLSLSLSDALGYPHIVRMWFDPSCSPVADPSWREGAKRDRAHTVRQHAQQENEAY